MDGIQIKLSDQIKILGASRDLWWSMVTKRATVGANKWVKRFGRVAPNRLNSALER